MAVLTHGARKEKAKRCQRYVADWIGRITGLAVGKDEPIESRQMGESGPDVRLDAAARTLFPFTVECKNTENWSLPSAIQQAKDNMYPGTNWLVVLMKNRHKPVAVLDADVFFKLLEDRHVG